MCAAVRVVIAFCLRLFLYILPPHCGCRMYRLENRVDSTAIYLDKVDFGRWRQNGGSLLLVLMRLDRQGRGKEDKIADKKVPFGQSFPTYQTSIISLHTYVYHVTIYFNSHSLLRGSILWAFALPVCRFLFLPSNFQLDLSQWSNISVNASFSGLSSCAFLHTNHAPSVERTDQIYRKRPAAGNSLRASALQV